MGYCFNATNWWLGFGMVRHPIQTWRKQMKLSNIKERSLPVLEQAAQRIALMAYEVAEQQFAFGFKHITYSFEGNSDDSCGSFRALFYPFDHGHAARERHSWTLVTFKISSVPDEDWWVFSDARITWAVGNGEVFFTKHGVAIRSNRWKGNEFSYRLGNGPDSLSLDSLEGVTIQDHLIF